MEIAVLPYFSRSDARINALKIVRFLRRGIMGPHVFMKNSINLPFISRRRVERWC